MPVICLGPICFPIWGLIPVFLVFAKQMWAKVSVWLGFGSAEPQNEEEIKVALKELEQDCSATPKVVAVTSTDQLENLKSSSKLKDEPLIVKFGAEWCGPCKSIGPFFHSLSASKGATFCSVDVDAGDAGLKKIATALPTFVVYKDKEEIHRLVGASEARLFALLQAAGLFGTSAEAKDSFDFSQLNAGECKT